ncbi:MAG: nicotinate-nucleotide adenylyltransferase [Deltaproteobacteria bacterium]|nr:nicotinate-nucleotide adenylyltransferase [Deltaproteobacteria bacterium]
MAGDVAYFGGTFDPIHIAHLRGVLEVAEEVGLAKVYFMPAATPPHRKGVQAGIEHRLAMVRLAVEGHAMFGVSDLEVRRGGLSRSVDTLGQLMAEHGGQRVNFLVGADAFFAIHTWHQARRLFDLADFLIMERPGAPGPDLLHYLRKVVDPAFEEAPDGWVRLPGGGGARWVHTRLLEISSTDIKDRVSRGKAITFLVPSKVEAYINKMKLYRQKKAEE